ncbi:hypothetical protein H5410_013068 [Solanum commersonii]|uniref:Uncharacterized protein n=1 Tax=Solanum commersonii TaxID=4109 RepID=A0A9J6AUE0_SOLCO|nr:hypothetical protein H5410_013068 [Solanum commersonii]
MGIPKDIAKLEVRHRNWGAIKKFSNGFIGYQATNILNVVVSRYAMMTQIIDECVGTLGRVSGEELLYLRLYLRPDRRNDEKGKICM